MPNGATITGQRKLDADVYGIRVGPYFQFPIWQKFSCDLSGGLSLACVNSTFKFNETVAIPAIGSVLHSGSSSHTGLLVGGYASGAVSYSFAKAWSASVGAQYQVLGRSS